MTTTRTGLYNDLILTTAAQEAANMFLEQSVTNYKLLKQLIRCEIFPLIEIYLKLQNAFFFCC